MCTGMSSRGNIQAGRSLFPIPITIALTRFKRSSWRQTLIRRSGNCGGVHIHLQAVLNHMQARLLKLPCDQDV